MPSKVVYISLPIIATEGATLRLPDLGQWRYIVRQSLELVGELEGGSPVWMLSLEVHPDAWGENLAKLIAARNPITEDGNA